MDGFDTTNDNAMIYRRCEKILEECRFARAKERVGVPAMRKSIFRRSNRGTEQARGVANRFRDNYAHFSR